MHINIAKVNFKSNLKSVGINIAKVDFGLYDVAKPRLDGLYITPARAGAISVAPNSSYYTLHGKYLKYSFDGKRWKDWTGSVNVQPGQKMYIKGEDYYVWNSSTFGKLFTSTSYYNVGGDISSLTNFEISYYSNAFQALFMNDKYVKDASNLILPATSLSSYYYSNMFNGCSGLTAAPALPATRLAQWCYASMFYNCSSLTTAPELPATTLANYCYSGMFRNCRTLTAAPVLPATTLTQQCYMNMFNGCSALVTAPTLPATTLAGYCYNSMFKGCSKLNNITMLATDISATNCLNNWVNGVASTGTFTKAASMTTLQTGTSGIPSGWNVVNYYPEEYLTISALGNGEITITIPDTVNSTYMTSLSYSKDKLNWTDTTIDNTEQIITIPVSSGDDVYLKGIARQLYNVADDSGAYIDSTANINVSGNIMSLLYGDGFKDKTTFPNDSECTFQYLFSDNVHLINAGDLILPATTLASACYYCMFQNCSSLTTAPELPATTLATWCYGYMFAYCNSLTTAPELPAPALVNSCYYQMFYNCSKLNNITMLATDISAPNCLYNWVDGIASTGTFTKAAEMTSLPTGISGIPSGWTVVDK